MSGLVMPQGGLIVPMGAKKKFEFNERRAHAQEIFDALGPLDDFPLFFGAVLVAKYIRTDIGTGVLIAAEDTRREDEFQGKAGLVLKLGPLAFKNRPDADFGGAMVKRGDWAVYGASDGRDLDLRTLDGMNVIHCRRIQDAEIWGTTNSPDRVW